MTGVDLSPCKVLEISQKPIGPFDASLGAPLVEASRYLVEATREGVSFAHCRSLVYSVLSQVCKTYLEEYRLASWGIKQRLARELAEVISGLFCTDLGDLLIESISKALTTSGARGRDAVVGAVAGLPCVDPRLLGVLLRISREAPSDSAVQRSVLEAIGRMPLPFDEKLAHVLDVPLSRADKVDILAGLLSREGDQGVPTSWLAGFSPDDEAQAYFLGQVLGRSAVHNPGIMHFIIRQHRDIPHTLLLEWWDGVRVGVTKLRESEESEVSLQVLEVVLDMLQDEGMADFARRVFEALEVQPEELPRKMLGELRPATTLSSRMPRLGKGGVGARGRWEVVTDAVYETLELAEALYSSLRPVVHVLQGLREEMNAIALCGVPELLEFALDMRYSREWRARFGSLSFSEHVLDQFEGRIAEYRARHSQAMAGARSEGREQAVQFHTEEIGRCDRILQERTAYTRTKTVSPYFAWELLNFAGSFWSQAVEEFAELYTEGLLQSDETEARLETCRHLVGQFRELLNAEAEAIGFSTSPLGLRGAATFLKAATNPSLRAEVLKYVQKARTTLADWPGTDEMVTALLEAAQGSSKNHSFPLSDSPRLKALESLVRLAEDNPPLSPQVRKLLLDALEEIESMASPLGADLRLAASLLASLGKVGIDYPSAQRIADTPGLQTLLSFCVDHYRVPLHMMKTVEPGAAHLMQDVLPLPFKSPKEVLLHSQDPGEQERAAEALGRMSNLGADAVTALIKAIYSRNEFVSMTAARSLHRQIVESRSSLSNPELEAIGYGLRALIESRTPGTVLKPGATLSAAGAYGHAFDTLWEINARLKGEGYFPRRTGQPMSRLAAAPLLEVLGGWLGLLGIGRLLAGKFASGLALLAIWGGFDALCCLWGYVVLQNRWFLCATPLAGVVWFTVPVVSAFYLRGAIDLERKCFEPLRHLSHR